MGTEKGSPPVLTPSYSDWLAVLKIFQYPESVWEAYTDNATYLFYIITEQAKVSNRDIKKLGPKDLNLPDLDEFLIERGVYRTDVDGMADWFSIHGK